MRLVREDMELQRRVLDATRAAIEFYLILFAIRHRCGDIGPTLIAKLQEMLGGHELEESDANHHARNTQFELYVFANLLLGGTSVRIAEPDLRLLFGREEAGVAVKRLTSRKQLARRVDEAAAQIRTSQVPGFVAVNLDRFLERSTGPEQGEDVAARGAAFEDDTRPIADLETRYFDVPDVLGILNFGCAMGWVWDSESPRFSFGWYRQMRRFVSHDPQQARIEAEHARAFWDGVMGRIENALQEL